MMDFSAIVLDDRFCHSGYGDGAKFDTEGEGGGTDGEVYVSIGDSSIDGGGSNVCHFPVHTEKLQVDHPFVGITYFVNFVVNLHVRVKMSTSMFHSHGLTMNHKIIALIIVVVAVPIIGYSQKQYFIAIGVFACFKPVVIGDTMKVVRTVSEKSSKNPLKLL
ncbi:hypothetical protein BCR42DRAFT_398643 [Absidia repens]|uniref:Uncharacterized protein n=1 Tax=Absidia repens TaxID=90262 RepID=A0A1X2HX80_9FUNG|nr:hypothetical protein BCR42DRAFT_398643 [Absidia repens]